MLKRFFIICSGSDTDILENCSVGEQNKYELESYEYNRPGIVSGELIGGNLSVLFSVSGTKYDIDTLGKKR